MAVSHVSNLNDIRRHREVHLKVYAKTKREKSPDVHLNRNRARFSEKQQQKCHGLCQYLVCMLLTSLLIISDRSL